MFTEPGDPTSKSLVLLPGGTTGLGHHIGKHFQYHWCVCWKKVPPNPVVSHRISHQTIAIYWGKPSCSRAFISTYGHCEHDCIYCFPVKSQPRPQIYSVATEWSIWNDFVDWLSAGVTIQPPKYECIRGMPNCAYILNNQQMGWWWFIAISMNS